MRKRSPFRVFVTAIWLMAFVFLPACGVDYAVVPVTQTPFPSCSGRDVVNLFSNSRVDDAVMLYQSFLEKRADPFFVEQYQKEAFLRLVEEVQSESATHVLFRDENQTILATMTLLSPTMVQYAILSQLMFNVSTYNLTVNPDDQEYSVPAVQRRLEDAMVDLAGRQELLFLFTIAYPPYDPFLPNTDNLSIKIEFEKIHLISASHKLVPPQHNNPDLGTLNNEESEMKIGLIGFPLGQRVSDGCEPILDQWDTNLTIEATDIFIGDTKIETTMWTVPYYPLIHDDFTHYGGPFYHQSQYASLYFKIESDPAPPTTKDMTGGDNGWQEYWWSMSQYVWHVVMTFSHNDTINPLQ